MSVYFEHFLVIPVGFEFPVLMPVCGYKNSTLIIFKQTLITFFGTHIPHKPTHYLATAKQNRYNQIHCEWLQSANS